MHNPLATAARNASIDAHHNESATDNGKATHDVLPQFCIPPLQCCQFFTLHRQPRRRRPHRVTHFFDPIPELAELVPLALHASKQEEHESQKPRQGVRVFARDKPGGCGRLVVLLVVLVIMAWRCQCAMSGKAATHLQLLGRDRVALLTTPKLLFALVSRLNK